MLKRIACFVMAIVCLVTCLPIVQVQASDTKNGICDGGDGYYYYYVNGQVQTDYTGLYDNGAANWYIVNGQVQLSHNGLVTVDGERYYIKGGCVHGFTGLIKLDGTWLYLASGQVEANYAGLVKHNGLLVYVANGEVDFNKKDIVAYNDGKMYYVKYGIVSDGFTGMAKGSDGVWRYIKNGAFDDTYVGLAKNSVGWWYAEKGLIDTTFTGLVPYGDAQYYIKWGQVMLNTTGVINIKGTQYYIKGGAWQSAFSGTYTDINGVAWNIVKGVVAPKCSHTIEAVAAKAATCTEEGNISYFRCTSCGRCYRDSVGTTEIALESTVLKAKGHTLLYVEAKSATTEESGNVEHWACNICDKYFGNSGGTIELDESAIVIPKLEKEQSTVVYNVYGSDAYLKSVGVENSNPSKFYAEDGLILDDLIAPEGYTFKGWTTASGTPITEIAPGSPRQITLNAVWSKEPYTITFYSPIAPRASIERTIDEAVPIDDLNELTKYKFMGWTDIYGNPVTMVMPGTKDITLYANWISYRNQTISNDYLSKGPIIIEDEENGQYLFVYDIGKIINVPLYTIKDFGNTTSGIIRVESESVTNSISSTTAKEITETIANSTTNSATWTLSQDWNELITNTEDFTESQLKENSVIISDGWAHTSGSETNTGTVTDTGTLSKDNTTTKDLTTHNAGGSVEVDVEIAKKGLAKQLSPVGVDIKAQGHYDYTHQGGTESDEGTDTYNLTHTNNLNSSSQSTTNSHDKTTSEKIAEEVSKQWGYSISKSTGGASSATENSSNTQSNESTYSTTFSYTVAEEQTVVKEYSTDKAAPGWHRLVCAGTVHVFAVVGYDIATHTYFYYTYSVLDDTTSEFYDYSATNGEYCDYETGVLPFEVPVSIHEYVTDKVYLTNGLIIDDQTGMIEEYEGDYTHVNIPDYYSRDNGDGTYDVVKITGIKPSVFANNTKIESVRLSNYITEIPENAFSGCSALRVVDYNKLESIGGHAFKDCTSLEKFAIDTNVIKLGTEAFLNAPEVEINACNYNVAYCGTQCGAKNVVLNLKVAATELSNCAFVTNDATESFTINGYKTTLTNFEIVSDCASVAINGITFDSNKGIPMTFDANNVVLTNVSVMNASGLAILLKSDNTIVVVNGSNVLQTDGEIAILCKEIEINKASGTSVKCVLQVPNGKIYICGSELTETGKKYLDVSDSQIEYITLDQYANMLEAHYVYFDANGGVVDTDKKLVMWNSALGELPTPTRTGYNFSGWFTEGGDKVTADTIMNSVENINLTAKWSIMSYKVSWDTGTGYSIDVSRTSSPNAGVAVGELTSGDTVYYGDVLNVTYTASTGYTLSSKGSTNVTVTGDVTAATIYADATVNSYTYNIVYMSSNGTALGTATATYNYGTTNTISPKAFSGYTAPAAQTLVWDSTSAKTITFTYVPIATSTTQQMTSGWWWKSNNNGITYDVKAEYRNRTANSVQIRVVWTQTISKAAFGYNQYFYVSMWYNGKNMANTGNVKIASTSTWPYYSENGPWHNGSVTASSGWITIPLDTTNATSVDMACDWWTESQSSKGSWSGKSIAIPAY